MLSCSWNLSNPCLFLLLISLLPSILLHPCILFLFWLLPFWHYILDRSNCLCVAHTVCRTSSRNSRIGDRPWFRLLYMVIFEDLTGSTLFHCCWIETCRRTELLLYHVYVANPIIRVCWGQAFYRLTCRFTQAGGGILLLSLSGFLEFSLVETPFQAKPKTKLGIWNARFGLSKSCSVKDFYQN